MEKLRRIKLSEKEISAFALVGGCLYEKRYPYKFSLVRMGFKGPLALECIETAIGSLQEVISLRDRIVGLGLRIACFVQTRIDSSNKLIVHIYIDRKKMSFIHELIEPFTLLDYDLVAISGGEERYYVLFDSSPKMEGAKNKIRKHLRDVDLIHAYEVDEESIFPQVEHKLDPFLVKEMGITHALQIVI